MKNNSKSTFEIGGELEINRLGYGAMQLTGEGYFGDPEDRENAIEVLKEAVNSGVNFIDTAFAYGPEKNEILIADALFPYQKDLIVATKGGASLAGPNQWVLNGDPENIRQQIDSSLVRLKLDHFDLWQLHRIDPNVAVEETLVPISEAVKAGKIKHFGLSEVTVEQIKQVQKILPVASIQNLYNLGDRQWESVLDYTAEQNIAFIPWYPLASGPNKLAEKVGEIAKAHNATNSQIALAWLLKRSPNIILIPGTKSITHLHENLAAINIELIEEEFTLLSVS